MMRRVSSISSFLILNPRFRFGARAYQGSSYDQIKSNSKKYFQPWITQLYKEPLLIVRGHKQFLYDQKGKQYIDMLGGFSVTNVGHSHPRLTKVYQDQADKLLHISPIYMQEYQGQYSKKLCQELGPQYDSVYLANSGGQAIDFAMMLARLYKKSQRFYCLRDAYHGVAGSSRGLTNIKSWNTGNVRSVEIDTLPSPYLYRSVHKDVDSLVKDAEHQLQATSNGKIAGFIAQPILGAGGVIPAPQGYLQKMYKLIRKYDGLCISDEVQSGFGRTGKQTWGFKWQNVKPDIVVTAKGIANGYPMAAVVTRKQIMDSVNFIFFNTYGGGPLQCRLGLQVLNIIKDQKLAENSQKIGTYLLNQFKRIQKTCPKMGQVRGKGMMIGIEIVSDPVTKQPGLKQAAEIMQRTKQLGVAFGKGGVYGNTIRVLGPLCLSMESAKKAVNAIEQAVKFI